MACGVPEVDDKQLTCAICIYIEQFKEPKVLPCLHTYCKGCLVKLVKKQGLDYFITCPWVSAGYKRKVELSKLVIFTVYDKLDGMS